MATGIVRRSSLEKFDRIEAITDKIRFVEGDLTDQSSLDQALQQLKPDELYNLAAQSFVPVSWNQPVLTADVTGLGALRVMEAIRKHSPQTKFLQASRSWSQPAIRRKEDAYDLIILSASASSISSNSRAHVASPPEVFGNAVR